MLEVTQLSASYGAIKALENVSVHVAGSEIVCLLGSNGAGKTTLLNTISGVVPAQQGRIRFKGEDITGKPIDQIVAMGLVQVPEGREIFGNLKTLDNLQLGAWTRRKDPRWKAQLETVFELFPRLKERSTQLAGTLSGGEQQMLMIGRALMASPSMITKNGVTAMAWGEMKMPTMFCTIPSKIPPTTQPGKELNPPMMAAAKANITMLPMSGVIKSLGARSNPAMPATVADKPQMALLTLFTGIPIRLAARSF